MVSHDARLLLSSSSSSTQHDRTEDITTQNNSNKHAAHPPMFELVNVHGRINLGSVYGNGLHALKQLEISNLTDQPILVKMRSNLRNQIAFQLKNENIIDLPGTDLKGIALNTVEWAQAELSVDHHFNQLFNYVNYIDYLELEPFETRSLILAFLPEAGYMDTRSRDDDTETDTMRDTGFVIDETADESDIHKSINVTGSLFFFGYYQLNGGSMDPVDTLQKEEDRSHPDSLITTAPADYQLSIKFRASVCRSVLWIDVAETGFNFDDCVLGETYYKDFTIQNKSEIALYWLLNTVDLSNLNKEAWIRFTDAETGEPLDDRPIPSFASRRIRMIFTPKEVGEFNYDLQVENANDTRNVVQCRVHASVHSVLRQESLVITSGTTLDFGDCLAGSWTVRQIVLANVSDSSVEVRFIPEAAEVVFDIKSALEPAEKPKSRASVSTPGVGADYRGRLNGRKSVGDKGTTSTITTPTPTVASTEVSGAYSDTSSRASSPLPAGHSSRVNEYDGSSSPASQDSHGARIQTPSVRGIPADNTDDTYPPDDFTDTTHLSTGDGLSGSGRSTPVLGGAGSYTRIEDLVLRPGKERTVQVSYRPRKDASITDFNAGQLIKRNFRFILEYGTYRSTEPKEKKGIQCRARTCTSFVEVIPRDINFGDTDVGTLKSLPIHIFNRSDILARVELQFTSKVLNCLRGEIAIQPRSYVELKLDLYPRKVNPEYRKQITLINFLNRDNDQIIEVQSTNIDKNRVTFHSIFYRILTATGANFLDFGSIVLNSPSIRTFTVENIRNYPLKLGITTSLPDDLVIYTKRKRSDRHTVPGFDRSIVPAKKAVSLERHGSSRELLTRKTSPSNMKKETALRHRQHSAKMQSAAYLDLATSSLHSLHLRKRLGQKPANRTALTKSMLGHRQMTGSRMEGLHGNDKPKEIIHKKTKPSDKTVGVAKSANQKGTSSESSTPSKRSLGLTAASYKARKNLGWPDIAGKSRVPFEDLISVLEHCSKSTPLLFPKQSAEEKYIGEQLAWRRELERLIEKGDLVHTTEINLEPHGEEEIVIVLTPTAAPNPKIGNTPRKQDARIFLELLEFDRHIEQTEFANLLDADRKEIPVREVIVRAQVCRSEMDLGQKNINFGFVERNERHAKSIVLHNRSETPLLYAIRKSGSIASGDIVLGAGRYGVVRSFGKREIDFVFEPTLAGTFRERLIVENIRDRTNDSVVLLKANVRKPSPFFIKSLEVAFGPCLVDQTCRRVETIVLTNTNKQSRLFEIRVDPNEANWGNYYGEFDFTVEDDDANTLTKEAEEEIENLEQKIKIARRKAQPDKVKKYLKKLAKLKKMDIVDEDAPGAPVTATDAVDPKTESKAAPAAEGQEVTTKENATIYKKTAESIVFPLEPNAVKTISVTFKAVKKPVQLASEEESAQDIPQSLPVQGRILVHEYKNTDVCKAISYTATIYHDKAAYNDALEMAVLDKDDKSDKKVTDNDQTPVSEQVKTPGQGSTEDEDEVHETLQLERTFFDGGRVEVNQKSLFYVRVTNTSDEPLNYEFVVEPGEEAFFIFPEATTPLAPLETRKLMFEILPTMVGKQQHTFSLLNRRLWTRQQYTLQCLVHYGRYLHFPSLSEESNGELNLGYSYVDPGSKYSQVTPLLVENVSGQDIYISCQSNLTHQVVIFLDEAGERGLVDMMPFRSGSMTTVWVAVQPNLLTGYLGSSADECRELVGGIKFSIYQDNAQLTGAEDPESTDMVLMMTQTVKFVSIIGQSHLEVSHKTIHLGYTDLLHEEFYGSFIIRNKSEQLPLDYEVECPSRNIVVDRRGGTLNGWRGARQDDKSVVDYLEKRQRRSSYDDIPAMSVAQISFRMNAYRYGLLTEKLIVINKHNSDEVFEIEVCFFVDCKRLSAWMPGQQPFLQSTSEDEYHENTDHREANPLPTIKWDSIYVCPIGHPDISDMENTALQVVSLLDDDEARLYMREIEVVNRSNEAMQLIALSDVDVTAGWVADEDAVKMAYVKVEKPYLQRSGQLELLPNASVRVRLQCPSTEKLNPYNRSLALQGQCAVLEGMFILYDMKQNVEVLSLGLTAVFCVSRAELTVDRIDLGQIGHITSWKPAKFNFSIQNMSDVPLTYSFEKPEFISLAATDKSGALLEAQDLSIAPRKTQAIEGTLDPRLMRDQTSGQQRFDVRIANQFNRNNTLHLRLKAHMTVFELCFDRLTNGVLNLPTLYHPISVATVPCDNWFVIYNTADDDIRFEIGADMMPDLEGYVKLDVLSRYTNTPLRGGITISPQSSMEIRVRASSNESSRLPSDRLDLIDPAGIVLAKLWVTTRPTETEISEDNGNMREMIPVRCVMAEAPIFSLSDRRLDFELVTFYQEDDAAKSTNGIEKTDDIEVMCKPESCPLTILNHAAKIPLRFRVTVEGPADFPASDIVQITPLAADGTGTVEPLGAVTLMVQFINPKDSIPGQFKIHVDDLDALGQIRQTASIFVNETVCDL